MNLTEYLPQMQKAIVGAIVTLVASQLAAHGFSLDMSVGELTQLLVNALVGGFFVWLVPNKK